MAASGMPIELVLALPPAGYDELKEAITAGDSWIVGG
jgi:hypothetical protein